MKVGDFYVDVNGNMYRLLFVMQERYVFLDCCSNRKIAVKKVELDQNMNIHFGDEVTYL